MKIQIMAFTLLALGNLGAMEKAQPKQTEEQKLQDKIESRLKEEPLEFTDVSESSRKEIENSAAIFNEASDMDKARAIAATGTFVNSLNETAKISSWLAVGMGVFGCMSLSDDKIGTATFGLTMAYLEETAKLSKQIVRAISTVRRIAHDVSTNLNDDEVDNLAIEFALTHVTDPITKMYLLNGGNIYHVAIVGLMEKNRLVSPLLKRWLQHKLLTFNPPMVLTRIFSGSQLNIATNNIFALTPLFLIADADIKALLIEKGATDEAHNGNLLRRVNQLVKPS
jgi:hypothetical protein